ncbi:hypothetical protein [Peribacillus muralis]|uniref:hypothetical protein n=1 Tax=Peribacillus muralis TaxID=264697 RepID=UPI00366BC5DC
MIIVRDKILNEDENYSQSNINSFLKKLKQLTIKEDGVCNGLGIHFIDNRYIWFCDEICTE